MPTFSKMVRIEDEKQVSIKILLLMNEIPIYASLSDQKREEVKNNYPTTTTHSRKERWKESHFCATLFKKVEWVHGKALRTIHHATRLGFWFHSRKKNQKIFPSTFNVYEKNEKAKKISLLELLWNSYWNDYENIYKHASNHTIIIIFFHSSTIRNNWEIRQPKKIKSTRWMGEKGKNSSTANFQSATVLSAMCMVCMATTANSHSCNYNRQLIMFSSLGVIIFFYTMPQT